MKLIYLLIPFFLLGCSSQRPMAETQPADPSASVPGTTLAVPDTTDVRHSEALKAYPLGRYEDPDDPSVMHEAHVVYRAEEPPTWNFNPTVETEVPLGPTVAVNDPAKDTSDASGELEQKIQQQNQLLQATFEQNQQLADELKTLQDDIAKTRGLAAANEALQKQVADLRAQLFKLQQEQEAQSRLNAQTASDQKSSWWSWWIGTAPTPVPVTSTSSSHNLNPTKGKK
jgi:hypothetical protein